MLMEDERIENLIQGANNVIDARDVFEDKVIADFLNEIFEPDLEFVEYEEFVFEFIPDEDNWDEPPFSG